MTTATNERSHHVMDERGTQRRSELDGLRGLAVAAVVLYHLDVPGFSGGFVGVDVFFVLSGYLITSRLLDEHQRDGRISLRHFWERRARRLWPMAWIVLAVIAAAGLADWWGADRQRLLPGETAAAFAHVANWWQAVNGGYLQRFASPSPLRHFWSLSIEEQFYVVWPLAVVAAIVVARRRGRSPVGGVAVAAAVLTVGSMAWGWWMEPADAYLHTGVRAVALLAGAILAATGRDRLSSGVSTRWATVAGLAAIGTILGVAAVATPETSWLAPGGFAAVAAASSGLTVAALAGGKVWCAALNMQPLVWLGVRSYTVYLVHWPIIVILDPDLSLLARAAITVVASLGIAALSFVAIEYPVMHRRVRARWLGAASLVLIAGAAVALVAARPSTPTPTELVAGSLDALPDPISSSAATALPSGATPPSATPCVPDSSPPNTFGGRTDRFDPSTMEEVVDPSASSGCDVIRVLVVGDSTGRGMSNGLRALADPRIEVWDRTEFGCSYATASHTTCPPWRTWWAEQSTNIQPDLVIVSAGVVEGIDDGDDRDFLEPSGSARRVSVMKEAVEMFRSVGAATMLTIAPVPRRPEGLFFCDRRARKSACDPEWVAAWDDSVRTASASSGAVTVDASGWLAGRGNTEIDRPDGLHLSAPAVQAQAEWLLPQVVAASGR